MLLVTANEMKDMDRETIKSYGIPGIVLMENAGLGATKFLLETYKHMPLKKIAIFAGCGNNGGDGYVIARYLSYRNIQVEVFLLSEKKNVKGDAKVNLKLLEPLNIPLIELTTKEDLSKYKKSILHKNIIVDAILGTGLNLDVRGFFRDVIEFINQSGKYIFSVDIPSGLHADTGQPLGISVKADATATFAFQKIGHAQYPGVEYTGKIKVIEIGIPPFIVKKINPSATLLTSDIIRSIIQFRKNDFHKGNTGHLLVVAGSPGKTGAAAMVAISAIRTGAGLVSLGIPVSLNSILETLVLEGMTIPLAETPNGTLSASALNTILQFQNNKKCMAIGPGIGVDHDTRKLVHALVEKSTIPVVIDADGLNCIADHPEILKKANSQIILTPHPGEMTRLNKTSVREMQQNKIKYVVEFSQKYNVHLILKGARTIIAHPDGKIFINPTGNPGMASGGMGDVLTGMISGFITQGYDIKQAIHAGIYLHGYAADSLAETKGPTGYLASDIINIIPKQIQLIKFGNK